MKDYYYILGVKPDASRSEIQKAYRKLSLKFHPDKNDGDKFFEERFKEIQEAWECLRDEDKRRQYNSKKGFENNFQGDSFRNDLSGAVICSKLIGLKTFLLLIGNTVGSIHCKGAFHESGCFTGRPSPH